MTTAETQLESSTSFEAFAQGLPCGRLLMKLATTKAEQEDIFRLRYRIFHSELGEGIPENEGTGLDVDDYDPLCDHLVAQSDGRPIGTYRLLWGPKRPAKGFYTESEFDLGRLQIDPAHTVEMGRGCVEPEFRKQTTLLALFWGLHRYMLMRNARYLIGCGSLPPMNADDAEATFAKLLADGRVDESAGVHPLKTHDFRGDAGRGTAQVPPLVSVYLEFGAKILGRPAYDPVFRCYDLPVLMDTEKVTTWGWELLERFDKRLLAGK